MRRSSKKISLLVKGGILGIAFAVITVGTISIGYLIGSIFGKIPTLVGMLTGATLGLILTIYLGMRIAESYSKEK